MKLLKTTFIASLTVASVAAFAMKNSDPAAGASTPKPVVKKSAVISSDPSTSAVTAPVKVQKQDKVKAQAVTPVVEKPVKKSVRTSSKAQKSAGAGAEAKAPAKGSLEEQLKTLDAGNTIPVGANREKMYAVQARYLPLRWKSEFTVGAASNVTGDSFIKTNQLEAGYRLHINDRWAAGFQYAWVDNQLKSSEVGAVKTNNGALPDVPYAKSRADLTAEFNTFYGKFRWTAETVSYFDQYIALGAAQIEQNTGTSTGYVGDLGFAFWMGKWGSARVGMKDYYYREDYRSGPLWTHNLHAHLDLGYLF